MGNKLSYTCKENNHVLIPNNKESKQAQEIVFAMIEKEQEIFINSYNVLTMNNKIRMSNEICFLFVKCFFNGDGASFRMLVGYEHKGLMTQEELKNIIRDFKIAKAKKKSGEFRTFLLLDLCIYSNRRADAIIINNDYKIELYDFSEGKIAEKIKNEVEDNLSKGELDQKRRKEKQQKRINSFKSNINVDSRPISNVIIDNNILNVKLFNIIPSFYDFNYSYTYFINNNYKKTYIPNSLCFLFKKEDKTTNFISYNLKYNIDSPFFLTEKRPIINNDIVDDIYKNNILIGLSIPYAIYFISEFTYLKIHAVKKQDKLLKNNQLCLLLNNKRRYIYLEDLRTQKWMALSKGIIEKHLFMNLSLKTTIIYIDSICNPEADDNFTYNVIKYEKLRNSEMNFFIIENN